MERKKTNPPNLLTRVVGCVSSPLSQRLEAAVDCRQTPDNWAAELTSCVTTASHLFGIESSKWTCQVAAATETFLGKSSSKANHTRKHWSWSWLTGNPPNLNTCPGNPTKPQPRVFLVSAGLATRPSHWQLASQPERAVRYPKVPDFSEILTFNLLGWVALCRYVVVTRLIALQLSRVKPQALDNSPSPTAPHSCSMGLPCRPGTTRPEFSKKTPYHRSCRVAWRRMLTSYAWLKMLRVLRSLPRIHS